MRAENVAPLKSFAWALLQMERGLRVQRAGWNGKDMWICQSEGDKEVSVDELWNRHTRRHALDNGGHVEVLPYFIMKTADGKILMGWLASQTDMIANDWQVVPEKMS